MASILRNEHRLRTVRITVRPSRSGAHLRLESYHGEESLERRDVPADLVGIRPRLNHREYRGVHFELPGDVRQAIADSLIERREDPDEPIWLQVGRSSGHLAVVPWERLLQESMDAPLLRIPNFLADPTFQSGRLCLVLGVSSPRAKSPFDVYGYTMSLMQAIREAVPQGTQVHVFADADAYESLRHDLRTDSGRHETIVHDPKGAAPFGAGDVDRSLSAVADRLQSPWLLWMQAELSGVPVDAVHFVCPGFFRRDRGALALARSPTLNVDRDWSHFVGPEELMAFLDLIGAWAAGFSPPHENVWAIGLRLLADRLAWERAGPLFLHDTESGDFESLERAYRFLFGEGYVDPPRTTSLMLYSHPKRLERYAEGQASFTAVRRVGPMVGTEEELFPEISKVMMKPDRSESASFPQIGPQWQNAGRVMMDRILLRAQDRQPHAQKGVLDALGFLSDILEQADDDPSKGRGDLPKGGAQ